MKKKTETESPTRAAVRAMLLAGMSVRQIAEALHISNQAVRKHVKKMELQKRKAS
jgi:predicted ArsR family transcriptional regulator